MLFEVDKKFQLIQVLCAAKVTVVVMLKTTRFSLRLENILRSQLTIGAGTLRIEVDTSEGRISVNSCVNCSCWL